MNQWSNFSLLRSGQTWHYPRKCFNWNPRSKCPKDSWFVCLVLWMAIRCWLLGCSSVNLFLPVYRFGHPENCVLITIPKACKGSTCPNVSQLVFEETITGAAAATWQGQTPLRANLLGAYKSPVIPQLRLPYHKEAIKFVPTPAKLHCPVLTCPTPPHAWCPMLLPKSAQKNC